MAAPPNAFDLAIVGGGIVGAGIARDASRRGLSVLLLEKNDFGWGTTARSTRLAHGGLRYLEFMDLGLVREGLRERATLLRIAPHLVRPLPFLFPRYRGRGRSFAKLEAGLALYDLLSHGRVGGRHRALSRSEVVALEPALDRPDLAGGFLFHDAQVAWPERLALENVLDAEAHGALCLNHAEVEGTLREGGRIAGVRARLPGGATKEWRARLVVNAAGPWVATVDEALGAGRPPPVRRTKGIHLLTPPLSRHALLVQARGERIFFVIPWEGRSLVGTTDTEFTGDNDAVAADADDVRYLLAEVNENLNVSLAPGDVQLVTAGVRALADGTGRSSGRLSRRHQLIDHSRSGGPDGLLTVVGGKITAYRAIAEEVVDRAARLLEARTRCDTADAPLPGAGTEAEAEGLAALLVAAPARLPAERARHLVALYGKRAQGLVDLIVTDPALREEIPGGRAVWAQVLFAVRAEKAATVEDVLLRRTGAALTEDRCLTAAPEVAARMGRWLGWSAERVETEVRAYRDAVALLAPPAGVSRRA